MADPSKDAAYYAADKAAQAAVDKRGYYNEDDVARIKKSPDGAKRFADVARESALKKLAVKTAIKKGIKTGVKK